MQKQAKNEQLQAGIKAVPLPHRPTKARPIKIKDLNSAKKLLERLIFELQTDAIDPAKAKNITYLLQTYNSVYKADEIETRLSELEKQQKENK
jgi:hypothetical protein